jgi:L-aminopeptidase/D-esterase-like protein
MATGAMMGDVKGGVVIGAEDLKMGARVIGEIGAVPMGEAVTGKTGVPMGARVEKGATGEKVKG